MDFDKNKYKTYTWKNWMVLHWMLNPGLMINELFLGQRVAAVSVVDKTSEEPLFKRTYIPCPYCKKMHDGRTWSTSSGTAFKNWFGLYCPDCGQIIPCVMNVFTWLVLAITYPIWGWFKNSLKAKWLKKQPQRFENNSLESMGEYYTGKKWMMQGFVFGLFMFIFNMFFILFQETSEITLKNLLVGFVICMFGGLLFGLIMKLYLSKRGKPHNMI